MSKTGKYLATAPFNTVVGWSNYRGEQTFCTHSENKVLGFLSHLLKIGSGRKKFVMTGPPRPVPGHCNIAICIYSMMQFLRSLDFIIQGILSMTWCTVCELVATLMHACTGGIPTKVMG